MPSPLKTAAALDRSDVVANSTMNRGRGLTGVDSYERELGFDPAGFLSARRAETGRGVAWLDLCSGQGRALIQAAGRFAAAGEDRITIVGVDLVGRLGPAEPPPPGVEFVVASLADWTPDRSFDLVTCVHGLHYLGDKLDLLARAAAWTAPDGRFAADFDPALIRHADGTSAARRVLRVLRAAGGVYDFRRHRLTWDGRPGLAFAAGYLGADDTIGPGYTGQPAVASHYTWA